MSGIARLMQMGAAGAGNHPAPTPIGIEDYFSTYLYTGNGSTQTITNGIDLAGEGGLVWFKSRTNTYNHVIFDTERWTSSNGAGLFPNATNAAGNINELTSFNTDGFSVTGSGYINDANDMVSWTFRKAPRFFDVVTYTGDGATPADIPHSLGVVPGAIFFKRTDASEGWSAVVRDGSNYQYWPNTCFTTSASLGTLLEAQTATDTVFKARAGQGWNTSGATYVAYLFAHDPLGPSEDGSDGLIACGSYTSDATGKATIDLGWEPQWVLYKSSSAVTHWSIADSMRGFVADTASSSAKYLNANQSSAELSNAPVGITSTGFKYDSAPNIDFIYIAIRRGPMRAPESGTEVFDTEVTAGSYPRTTLSGFPVDLTFGKSGGWYWFDRMRGAGKYISSNNTGAESSTGGDPFFDVQDGVQEDGGAGAFFNTGDRFWMFRRAPGFFDVVAYTGTGSARTISHNLGAVPELMIVKCRSNADREWSVYHSATGNAKQIRLSSSDAPAANTSVWNSTSPTATVFSVGANANSNLSGGTFISYHFASLPGVSKVGSYTGNGTSQTIDCGFTTGARFILIKRTDSTGDWYVWDTALGIVTGNDPHLSLNTTAAEVTTDDSIDPEATGFIVNQLAATNINVSSASYIFYAVA